MLVLNPIAAHVSPYPYRAPMSHLYPSEDHYFDSMVERAAQEYAAARARVQALEHQREHARRQRYLDEAVRRQAELDSYYRQQSRLIAASVRASTYEPARRPSACAIEELAFSVRRDEERRRVLLARQREAQRVRALAEARQREEAQRRQRARMEAHRAQEKEALFTFLGLAGLMSEASSPYQSRVPAGHQASTSTSRGAASYRPRTNGEEDRDELQAAFERLLSELTTPSASSQPSDPKGKGKAVDVPSDSLAPVAPSHAPQQTSQEPSFKDQLEARMRTETDPEVQEALIKLYSDIFDAPRDQQPVAGPSVSKHKRQSSTSGAPETPASVPPAQTSSGSTPEATAQDEGVRLHRTPALPPAVAEKLLEFYHARRARKLSLAQIRDVEDALRKLEATFEFPEHLDFVNPVPDSDDDVESPGPLAYTANNTPVHAYEHALNGLLTRLDAVESNGDLEVRGRRKEVVREVERALEAVERRVEESRERERERSRERARGSSVASSDVGGDAPLEVVPQPEVSRSTLVPAASNAADEVPEADTVSAALVDTPSPVDSTPDTYVEVPAAAVDEAPSAPSPDVVSSALVDVPPVQVDPVPAPTTTIDIVEAPEPDSVNVELVDTSSAEGLPSDPADPRMDCVPHAPAADTLVTLDDPTPTSPAAPEASVSSELEPTESQPETYSLEDLEVVSPVAPSEETFITAPSTLPPTSIPTPEAITRETSSATDATFLMADSGSITPSPSDAGSAPMARSPSEAPSTADDDTFLLSSHPLADDDERTRKPVVSEEDEPELISKEEVAKSDSDWSDVDA